MAMTREQVLAEMEASFGEMTEDEKNEALFDHEGISWTPTLLLAEVQNDTDFGKEYVQRWSQNKESQAQLQDLLLALLGGGPGGGELLTCGDPDCPNCHGEVRPFLDEPTGTDDI